MKLAYNIAELNNFLSKFRNRGRIIGFVPTMGALHNGHLSLVETSGKNTDITVVSIFVNPAQFNNIEDLNKYPRTLKEDIRILETVLSDADVVFIPDELEIYPVKDKRQFDFGELGNVMEGKHRPGHFNGVAQVVSRLFNLVMPHQAFFGEKDYQQLLIVKHLVRQLNIPVEIVSCPIVREPDGLAMSSRNQRLTHEQRQSAVLIYETLTKAISLISKMTVTELEKWVIEKINNCNVLKVEYFNIVDPQSLKNISSWNECDVPLGCIAVYAGNIRLIDNMVFK